MVSTTTFVSVDMSTAPDTPPAPTTAAFKLSGVSLNGVSPASLADLLDLGKARDGTDGEDLSAPAQQAFAGRTQFENDVAYFKALLATRLRMRLAHQANLQSLRDLRKKNGTLIRKRQQGEKARRAAKTTKRSPTGTSLRPPVRKADTNCESSVATTTILSSAVTIDAGAHVPDFWQTCSSPVSTEGVDDHQHIKASGNGLSFGRAGAAARNA